MKVKVAMDEKPAIITTDVPTPAVESSEKKSYKVKYIVLAVAAVCIVVAIIAGFVVAFKYHAETTSNIIKTHYSKDGIDEDIEEDTEDNSKLYRVTDKNGETYYILDDPSRKLSLVKRDGKCVLKTMGSDEDTESVMIVDKSPIKDRNLLSKRGQDLCEDLEIYWARPSCEVDSNKNGNYSVMKGDPEDTESPREKRHTGLHYYSSCYCPCYLKSPYCTNYYYCTWASFRCRLYLYNYWVYYLGAHRYVLYCRWYLYC